MDQIPRSNRSAMALAWNFFKGNYALNFAAIAILIVLTLLGAIPIIGMLFIFAYSIVSLSIQIYFGRAVLSVKKEDEIAQIAADTKISNLLSDYIHVAAGGFLALFSLSLLFMMLFGLSVGMSGGVAAMENGAEAQMQMMAMLQGGGVISLLLILIAGFFLYFFPAVMGRVIKSDTFVDGFKNVFLLFGPSLWKNCFHKEYFTLVFIWSLILIGVGFVLVLLSATVILLPVVLVIAYLLSLYNAAVYVFADDLAQKSA